MCYSGIVHNQAFPRVCGGDPGKGMYLYYVPAFPRVCGGDPDGRGRDRIHERFSPRVRG